MQAYAWKRPTASAMASATPLFFFFFFFFLLLLNSACTFASAAAGQMSRQSAKLDRSSFPAGFVFGSGSSSYQVEGAASEFGRGPSIWDTFTHNEPDKIADRSTGDDADGFYYHYKEDIAQMKAIGFDAFRFSISWSRIFPKGKLSGGVNPLGVQFYNDLIDNILLNGLKPYVTLFHWDLPQALDDEYGGFLSHMIMNDYLDYVDFCFKTYGDRVKYWFTVNEPYEFSALGYAKGIYAPGRCSNYVGNCTLGNSATEPYIVGHHLLLSHAAAVRLYREKYKASQKGQIGVTLSSKWYEPFSNDNVSQKAALRAVDFVLGWFLHPITYGNYPQSMQSLVGNRLPKFTKKETEMLKESFDFLGINYYSSYYAADARVINTSALSMTTDNHIIEYMTKNGVPIGKPTDLDWLYIYPDGLRKLLLFIKDNYGNPTIIVTENGLAEVKNSSAPVGKSLKDELRIHCYREHLKCLSKAIKEGADVRGYFIWSFIDNFEWCLGYNARFGITYVDYKGGLRRYLKDSAIWFSEFLQGRINALFRPSTFGLPDDQSSTSLLHANK